MKSKELIAIEDKSGVKVARLMGHLDLETAPQVKPQLIELAKKPHCKIILDLAETSYISSFGLSLPRCGVLRGPGFPQLALPALRSRLKGGLAPQGHGLDRGLAPPPAPGGYPEAEQAQRQQDQEQQAGGGLAEPHR